ncbi:DUF5707 domain-containing protein [Streptomyces sp. NPDC093109]|uniref:DUF5707 domain-containing protein n=1 Tax=Streptomyces sp. NPDC093109 TaxID=3154977 RepID=UPI00344D33FC
MRMRATVAAVAAVTGALALSGLVVPVASAATTADPVVSKGVVNGGKPIVVSATTAKKVTVSITASHSSGIKDAFIALWKGKNIETTQDVLGPNEDHATCKAASATTSTCTMTITLAPKALFNTDATTWKLAADVDAKNGATVSADNITTTKIQRASQLTVAATPKPVKKGKTLTVTGKLSRANWETGKNAGYGTQPVKLQFRKKGATAYTTVKTVNTATTGALKTTTTKTTATGYWRWSFAGTASSPAVNSADVLVSVN